MGAATTSEIEHVTVYARGARVRRVTPPVVTGEIRITGLPLGVVDDTVRAEVLGDGIVTSIRVELDAAGPAERANDPFDQELRTARARLVALDAEVARLSAALSQLDALAPAARRPRPDGAAVPAWSRVLDARLAVLDLRVAREAELRTALDAARRDLRDAHDALSAAQDRAARATTGRGLRVHELCKAVVASVDGGATARLAIEYLIGAARWAPTYCARLAAGRADLELRAVIAQNTGEDWRGARLTLSTAEPMRFAELPELPMARIGRRQPMPQKRGFRALPEGVEALYQDYDRAFPTRRGRATTSPFADEITKERPTLPEPELAAVPAPAAEWDTDEHVAYSRALDDDAIAELGDQRQAPPARRRSSETRPGAPAPAPTSGAPLAYPVMAPQARGAKTMLAAVGGLVAAPLGAVAAGAMALKGRMRGRDDDEADTGAIAVYGDEAVQLLAYTELRMQAPSDPRRGKLVRVGAVAAYAEALAARHLSLSHDADLAGAIAQRAAAIESLPLPPGTAASWDHVYDHAFVADAPIDVPSDRTWHAITLTAKSAPVVVRHVVVPREGTEVFRIAELANPLGAPMLPGPIDVFDEGVYLLTSNIDGVPAGAPVELGLGVDPKVKCSRNTDYHEEASGVLRGSLKLEHAVAIEIANHAARPVDVEVRERVPIVPDGEDDIEVNVTRAEPRWEKWAPPPAGPYAPRLEGGYRWRLTVPSGETRKLAATYAIRIASKHELVGGNRRES